MVGELDGKVIATCMAGYDGRLGWLYSLAVNPGLQNKGYGRQIVQHAVAVLTTLGCVKVNLQIRADNHEVESFYKTLGFDTEARISMGMWL